MQPKLPSLDESSPASPPKRIENLKLTPEVQRRLADVAELLQAVVGYVFKECGVSEIDAGEYVLRGELELYDLADGNALISDLRLAMERHRSRRDRAQRDARTVVLIDSLCWLCKNYDEFGRPLSEAAKRIEADPSVPAHAPLSRRQRLEREVSVRFSQWGEALEDEERDSIVRAEFPTTGDIRPLSERFAAALGRVLDPNAKGEVAIKLTKALAAYHGHEQKAGRFKTRSQIHGVAHSDWLLADEILFFVAKALAFEREFDDEAAEAFAVAVRDAARAWGKHQSQSETSGPGAPPQTR